MQDSASHNTKKKWMMRSQTCDQETVATASFPRPFSRINDFWASIDTNSEVMPVFSNKKRKLEERNGKSTSKRVTSLPVQAWETRADWNPGLQFYSTFDVVVICPFVLWPATPAASGRLFVYLLIATAWYVGNFKLNFTDTSTIRPDFAFLDHNFDGAPDWFSVVSSWFGKIWLLDRVNGVNLVRSPL